MFTRILVANRGEIACRVFRTCRAMGIATVAVYSDADAGARHVREADAAVRIGPAAARASYLDAEAVIAAAIATRADAIHPGYGFLSEKLELIDACAREGIVFIGPHRDAIASMGSKIESKRIARAAGVPCVPGYDGDDQSGSTLAEAARSIGFPLLIKASAGGGGKGMKRVDAADAFDAMLAAARAEALAAFGDDRVLLERLIERPRHLEVQLLGDRHGGLVHLFERECSIQRNYQKLVEEAPAAHLSGAVREKLFDAARTLGRAIGYDSAGTVEFVLDAGGDTPYFLEMNTRLQVEHPVTELTTTIAGRPVDLVERQIRAAAGEPLGFAQADVAQHGWAIEARINAEVPDDGFRASFGRIDRYGEPVGPGIRIDSGVDATSTVTPHYDAMLAKAIGFGPSRAVAKARLTTALRAWSIEGVRTNRPLLVDVVAHPAFDDELTTRFLDDAFPDGWRRPSTAAAAAALWFVAEADPANAVALTAAPVGFRLTAPAGRVATCGVSLTDESGRAHDVEIRIASSDRLDVVVRPNDAGDPKVDVEPRFDGGVDVAVGIEDGAVVIDGRRYEGGPVDGPEDDLVRVAGDADWQPWTVVPAVRRRAGAAATDGGAGVDRVTVALPGVLTRLDVAPGDRVQAGASVAVVEAMKLLHTLVAPRDAIVAATPVAVGATVGRGTVVVAFEPLA